MGIIGVPAAGRGGRKEVEPMEQQKIDRINQLARKSKSPEGLAPEELAEQAALRQEYIAAYRASLTAQLDNTYIQYPDGTRRKLRRRG